MASVKNKKKLVEPIGSKAEISKETFSLEEELTLACKKFHASAIDKPILNILILIDPIRALKDAGFSLSNRAKKQIYLQYPDMAYENEALYKEVSKNPNRLHWIKDIRTRKPRRKLL